MDDLVNDFSGREISLEPLPCCQAETAPHGTACLGRDAKGEMSSFRNEHGLNEVAVFQFEKKLGGSVLGNLRLLLNQVGDASFLLQLRPKALGDIRHVLKGGDQPFEQPLAQLPGPVSRKALGLDPGFGFRQAHAFQVRFHRSLTAENAEGAEKPPGPGALVSR